MEDESLEDRIIEVLQIPDFVDDDLLWLYFENRKRSGGGKVTSLTRTGDKVLLVFEDAEVATSVVQKGSHTISNSQIIVRKKPPKDHGKLLLRGLPQDLNLELLELYVESLTGLDSNDYTLYLSPGKDLVLIYLHQPAAEDFKKMCSKVSKRSLNGAHPTLEQVEYTDTIMVGNLTPNLTEDLLTLYFESSRSGGGDVVSVSMMSQQLAKVTFKDVQSVDCVIQTAHKLEETDLMVKPYYSFLHSEEEASLTGLQDRTDESLDDQVSTVSPLNNTPSVLISDPPPSSSSTPSSSYLSQKASILKPDLQVTPEPENLSQNALQVQEVPPAEEQPSVCHVSIPDPIKRKLVALCDIPEKLKRSNPGYEINVTQNGVEVKGPAWDVAEKLKRELLEFLSGVTQVYVSLGALKADFLRRQEVRDHLMSKLKDQGLPCTYTLTGTVLILSSASMQTVTEAREVIQGTVSEFVLRVEPDYEYIVYSDEWRTFLQGQDTCSAQASDRGHVVSVVTLKDVESEVKGNLVRFLNTHIEKEEILSMQPGMLTYIQLHHEQLLRDMAQVIILPLDTGDGLSIQGNPTAVQMVAEVLHNLIDSTYTKIITVNQPGIARFLLHDDEGRSILEEMTIKFQVYINVERVHWDPVEEQDIFALAWKMTSSQNFVRSSNHTAGASTTPHKDISAQIEEAKKILSLPESMNAAEEDMELYLCPEEQIEKQLPSKAETHHGDLVSLDEDACLSLAIQMSMEKPDRLAEEELQEVLQLSKAEAMSTDESQELGKAVSMSLQAVISLANTAQIEVFACYPHDLVRVDIALGKKAGQRQYEEKLLHKSLRKLSSFHRLCVDLIKRKHAVDVRIQGTTATVSGFKNYVTGALLDMNELLKRMEGSTTDGEMLNTVQWLWHDPELSAPTPYSPKVTVFIENAWRMKQDKLDILLDNQPHTIDFTKMQEFSVSSGRSTAVSRKLVNSTEFHDTYSLLSDVPDAVRLDECLEEYNRVTTEFFSSLANQDNIQIIQVEKLANRLLYSQYQLKKADMEQKVRGEVERTLYHGTSESSVKEICIHGFNRSFCGKNATAFGQGVYFAVKSSYSVSNTYSPPNTDGHKFILVARVLTGDFTTGRSDMRTAPLRENSDIPVRYHSVVDNTSSPSLFVIFNDTQAYPQYLITCRRVSH